MSGIILRMPFDVASHQARAYTVTTPVYEGPLDLLLQLIDRAELDISTLALAQVTDQYLAHMRELPPKRGGGSLSLFGDRRQVDPDQSKSLLPRPVQREEGEEDSAEALAQQPRLYKRYKELSQFLGQRELANLRSYLRLSPPTRPESSLDLSGVELYDLVAAAHFIFSHNLEKATLSTVVAAPRIDHPRKDQPYRRIFAQTHPQLISPASWRQTCAPGSGGNFPGFARAGQTPPGDDRAGKELWRYPDRSA